MESAATDRRQVAECHCGSLRLICAGEPLAVVQCHCRACQRRTGSAFNLAAWFQRSDVQVQGESKSYQRKGDLGIETTFHFCPTCGSNVYWTSAPEAIGIAVGCFQDADFPKPTITIYDSQRHRWILPVPGVETHPANGEGDGL